MVHTPQDIGHADVLISGTSIAYVGEPLEYQLPDAILQVNDLNGKILCPGLIDGHAHILGGGGGAGYSSRIPEIRLTDLTANGITTVVGVLGVDSITRSIQALLAKACALESEGVSAFILAGGFRRPPATLTGTVTNDVYAVPYIRGVKVALGEVRASIHSRDSLVSLARELSSVEHASGRSAILHVHLGQRQDGLELLRAVLDELPDPSRLVVTHCNNTETNLEGMIPLGRAGVLLDMTCKLSPARGRAKSVPAAEAVMRARAGGVPLDGLSMSTDGNGTVANQLPDGSWEPYRTEMESLWEQVRDLALQHGFPLAEALAPVTVSPASALRILGSKGQIKQGSDADLLVLGSDFNIHEVYAKGNRMVQDGRPIRFGRYE